jgi:hypothetical protein
MKKTIIGIALLSGLIQTILIRSTDVFELTPSHFIVGNAKFSLSGSIYLSIVIVITIAALFLFKRKAGAEITYQKSLLLCILATCIELAFNQTYLFVQARLNREYIYIFPGILKCLLFLLGICGIYAIICLGFRKPFKEKQSQS